MLAGRTWLGLVQEALESFYKTQAGVYDRCHVAIAGQLNKHAKQLDQETATRKVIAHK